MAHQSKSSSKHRRKHGRSPTRQTRKEDDQVYVITGASESVVADSERKNRIYAVLIGVRIASLFVVIMTEGWVQFAVFVGGMLAPWIGVQIANNIRQVSNRSIQAVAPQQAAIEAATKDHAGDAETVIVGDVVNDDTEPTSATPSAETSASGTDFDENEKDDDDERS